MGLDFLQSEETTPEPAIEVQAPEVVTEPPPVEPPVQEVVAPPASPQVPLAALREERDKRQALEARLAALEASREPEYAPDFNDDPQGALQALNLQTEARLWEMKRTMSRQIAELRHTPETVEEAHNWGFDRCNTDPVFNAQVAAAADPYEFVLNAYKREQIVSNVDPAEYDAFRAWKAAQSAAQSAPVTPVSVARVTPPPKSILDAPGASSTMRLNEPSGPGAAFDAAFTR